MLCTHITHIHKNFREKKNAESNAINLRETVYPRRIPKYAESMATGPGGFKVILPKFGKFNLMHFSSTVWIFLSTLTSFGFPYALTQSLSIYLLWKHMKNCHCQSEVMARLWSEVGRMYDGTARATVNFEHLLHFDAVTDGVWTAWTDQIACEQIEFIHLPLIDWYRFVAGTRKIEIKMSCDSEVTSKLDSAGHFQTNGEM